MKVVIGAIVFILFGVSPVHAQNCPQWMWGCWQSFQQPEYRERQPTSEPRHHTTRPIVHHREREYREPKPTPKPTIQYRTKTVTVTKSWKDMSQDQGRDWIMEQAKAFCGRYPDDKACLNKKE
jgi:hypothetical protein